MALVLWQDLRALAKLWPVLLSPPHIKTLQPPAYRHAKIALNFYSNLPTRHAWPKKWFSFLQATAVRYDLWCHASAWECKKHHFNMDPAEGITKPACLPQIGAQ